jgi:hypothetical protein
MQGCFVGDAGPKVKKFAVLGCATCFSSSVRLIGRNGGARRLSWRRLQMSEFIALCEARTLMTDALRVVNDVGEDALPELGADLRCVRHHLDSAIQSVDRAMDPDPSWPGLAARA